MSKVNIKVIPPHLSLADDLRGKRVPEQYMFDKNIVSRESLGMVNDARSNQQLIEDLGLEDTLIGDVCPVTKENVSLDVLSEIMSERNADNLVDVCGTVTELIPVVSVKTNTVYGLDRLFSNQVSHVYFSSFVGKSVSPKNQAAIDKMVSRSLFLNDPKGGLAAHVLLAMPAKSYTANSVLASSLINLIDVSLEVNKSKSVSISSPPTNFSKFYKDFKKESIQMTKTETEKGVVVLTFSIKDKT